MNTIFASQKISPTSYRFWQHDMCILVILNGPTSVQTTKAGQTGILDIHMKMESDSVINIKI